MDVPSIALHIALIALSYLAGSIPFGVLVARLSGGVDPRTIGSGRTGGTNALRALGRKRAAIVVLGDLAKGAGPVLLARVITADPAWEVACAAAAVAGAIWSVFAGFRSGRGVGTAVGTLLVIQPLALFGSLPVFVIVILITRYVSLGSLLGSAALLPAMLLVGATAIGVVPPAHLAWGAIGAVLVWIAHADNIGRLLSGSERRFDLGLLTGSRGAHGS